METRRNMELERIANGLDTPKKLKPLPNSPKPEVKANAYQRVKDLENEKHIRELEARLSTVNRDNEALRAEVDEAKYYIYDHGAIKKELYELRRNNIMNLAELNRLTQENSMKIVQLAHAEEQIRILIKFLQAREKATPPPQRAQTTQNAINRIWLQSFEAARANERDENAVE